MRSASPFVAIALGISCALSGSEVIAYPDGREIGRSRVGCGTAGCHGANAGATVTIAGPMSVAPGARSSYTLVINSTYAGFVAGGCDVSVTGATLAVSAMQQGTRINNAEIVHNQGLRRTPGGALSILFDVRAPTTPGNYTIYAAGNATNGMTNDGDAWGLASLRVAVAGAGVDAGPQTDSGAQPDATAPVDAAPFVDDGPSAPDGFEAWDPSRSEAYGRCSVARVTRPASRTLALWCAAFAVALASRRRAKR